MALYDLCLPWYWEYDAGFAHAIERACAADSLSLWQITPEHLLESVTDLYTGQAGFSALLDRANDDARFEPIRRLARDAGLFRVNPAELSKWSEDKATMHLELIAHGLNTPYTILLPPFLERPVPPPFDLHPLGADFVIKPSNGGGGEGVVLNATMLEQILRARLDFPDQKYLVQSMVAPRSLGGRKAWFRVYYVDGTVLPCWWDPQTHASCRVSSEEETAFGLAPLRELTLRVASICRLDWFSTEIAGTEEGRFVVVDYVNDHIDMRPQSQAGDGVPDSVIEEIARGLVKLVKRSIRPHPA